MAEKQIERRKFKRLAAYLPVHCRVGTKGGERDFFPGGETASKNISCGGMLLKWPTDWRCRVCAHYRESEGKGICEVTHCIYEGALLPNMELLELELEVGFPKFSGLLRAWGKVVWVRETDDVNNHDLGLEFTQMGETEGRAIADYVQERLAAVIEEQRRTIGELEKGKAT